MENKELEKIMKKIQSEQEFILNYLYDDILVTYFSTLSIMQDKSEIINDKDKSKIRKPIIKAFVKKIKSTKKIYKQAQKDLKPKKIGLLNKITIKLKKKGISKDEQIRKNTVRDKKTKSTSTGTSKKKVSK